MLTIGSLFSGYGGLDLAALAAIPNSCVIWHAENDTAASRILTHHWPDTPNLGDITRIDWQAVPRPDIITGGSPCQDISIAGRMAGLAEGTRSNLWVTMRQAIAHLQPRLVIWENVSASRTTRADSRLESCPRCVGDPPTNPLRVLGRVLADLATIRYDARWKSLRASDVGAPHKRERIFLIAYPQGDLSLRDSLTDNPPVTANSDSTRPQRPNLTGTDGRGSATRSILLPTPTASLGEGHGAHDPHQRRASRRTVSVADVLAWQPIPLTETPYWPAIDRWQHALGRPHPTPVAPNKFGNPKLTAEFVEWMMGLPEGWVTDTPGISWNAALKILGNGVVPQQGTEALRSLLSREDT